MAKLLAFTNWNPDNRYKLLGKIFRTGSEVLFIFNLDSKLTFPRKQTDGGKIKTSRTPVYSIEWEKPFGPDFFEHRKQMESRVFKGYTVISVADKKKDDQQPAESITATAEQQDNKRCKIITELLESETQADTFDKDTFTKLVETVRVYSRSHITIIFKDGTELKADTDF